MGAFDGRLERLHEQRERAFNELKAVVDHAESESRSLDGEEQGKFDKISDDLTKMDAEIASLDAIAQRSASVGEMRTRMGIGGPNGAEQRDDAPSPSKVINDNLRAVAEGRMHHFDIQLGEVESRSVSSNRAEGRTLLVGTTNAAGTITQPQFIVDFQSALIDRSSLLSLGPRVITTEHANNIDWPRQLTRMATSGRVTEGGTILKPTDPTFDRVTLHASKYASIAQISHEMIEDGAIDLSPLLVSELAGSVAWAFNTDLYTGNGTNMPYGLLTRTTAGVTGGTAAAPTFDNLIDLEHALNPQYRPGAVFVMNDSTLKVLRKVKDSTGEYIFQQGTTGGIPSTILGRRFVLDTNIPAVGAGNKSVVLFDPEHYWVRQVRSVRLERSDEYAFDTDLVSWKCVFRGGGDLMDTNGSTAYASA